MRFKSTYIKLTLFYVAIIMLVSVVFSIAIYQISSQELSQGFRRQNVILRELSPSEFLPQSRLDFENARNKQIEDSNYNLKMDLVFFNLVILVAATGVSYLLARKTLKPIEEMFDIQNHFTADASHELRTPLTAMKTEIEVSLRDEKFNIIEAKDLLKSNLEEISKLESLSNGLLTLTQFQNGYKVDLVAVSIREVIRESCNKLAALAKQKDIDLSTNVSNLKVRGDYQSLVKLFVTLLDNAIKYSPTKSKIIITSAKNGNYVEIKVKDQGVGIKSSDIPHIFNPFFRADQSRSKNTAGGYGLGLSIAKKIIQTHEGKIEVTSKPDQGTTFSIKLPKFTK
ncbi:MAG: HAMP domain-containing sensor histidine kinase [Patescibacteria group bacterium]|nr:HAMP domain-containing sensor histidine kinase [Patescibacteria group bacterium]